MIDERFVLLGITLNFLGGISYLVDTVKGKAKPNRISWLLWSLAPLIAFAAEIKQGVGIQSLMTFIVGFNPLLIFLASFINKKSVWKIQKFDFVCGGLSIIGLVFWLITRVGNMAILFGIMADGLASVPTLVKSYHDPKTESYLVYLLGAINATITLLTIKTVDFAHNAFPVYILVIDIILFVLIKFQIGMFFKRSKIAVEK